MTTAIDLATARYQVPLRHRDTGERRAITVTLPRAARIEAQWNVALGGSDGCAWPIANKRAVQAACARMPGYEWSGEAITASPPPVLSIVSRGYSDGPRERGDFGPHEQHLWLRAMKPPGPWVLHKKG